MVINIMYSTKTYSQEFGSDQGFALKDAHVLLVSHVQELANIVHVGLRHCLAIILLYQEASINAGVLVVLMFCSVYDTICLPFAVWLRFSLALSQVESSAGKSMPPRLGLLSSALRVTHLGWGRPWKGAGSRARARWELTSLAP